MSLYTKTGDGGETGLFDGSRVSKDHLRVAAYGAVDETNALLGWTLAAIHNEVLQDRLGRPVVLAGAGVLRWASSKQ